MNSMLEFLIDNIFVEFGGKLFQQIVGIPLGTMCSPLRADLYLCYMSHSSFRQLPKIRTSKKLDHLIPQSDKLMNFFPLTIQTLLNGFH